MCEVRDEVEVKSIRELAWETRSHESANEASDWFSLNAFLNSPF